jgi:mono/diheme cytochrome c family protein
MIGGGTMVALALSIAVGAAAQGKWATPADEQKVKNPVAKSDKALAAAKKSFETNCVACHGAKGLGDGLAAASLPVKPANWTAPDTQKQTDGELYWKITNGRGPMPAWKHLSDNERWGLVHFMRTFAKK